MSSETEGAPPRSDVPAKTNAALEDWQREIRAEGERVGEARGLEKARASLASLVITAVEGRFGRLKDERRDWFKEQSWETLSDWVTTLPRGIFQISTSWLYPMTEEARREEEMAAKAAARVEAWKESVREEGRAEVLEKVRRDRAKLFLGAAENKFGALDDQLRERLEQAPIEVVERWMLGLIQKKSLEELRAELGGSIG